MSLKVESFPPDSRGEIHRLTCNGIRVNLLFSRKGSARSGDYHPCAQFDAIIRGAVKISMMVDDETRRERKVVRCGGEFYRIPKDVPHLFEFAEDTWMLEWWGADGECEAKYYRPYREIVEENIRCNTQKR